MLRMSNDMSNLPEVYNGPEYNVSISFHQNNVWETDRFRSRIMSIPHPERQRSRSKEGIRVRIWWPSRVPNVNWLRNHLLTIIVGKKEKSIRINHCLRTKTSMGRLTCNNNNKPRYLLGLPRPRVIHNSSNSNNHLCHHSNNLYLHSNNHNYNRLRRGTQYVE